MAAPRVRKHIVVPGKPTAEAYKPHPRKIDVAKPPAPPSRATHARALKRALDAAVDRSASAPRRCWHPGARRRAGTLRSVRESARRALEALVARGRPPRHRACGRQLHARGGLGQRPWTTRSKAGQRECRAAPSRARDGLCPRREREAFRQSLRGVREDHAEDEERATPRRHVSIRWPRLRLATLRALWTDSTEVYPADDETIWWEVWLRRQDGSELGRLMEFAGLKRLDVAARRL